MVSRVYTPRTLASSEPRDITCRLHLYAVKTLIIQAAWSLGSFNFQGSQVKIMPDLSGVTLRLRTFLHLLLEAVHAGGYSYRLGRPFHLLVKNGDRNFALQCPTEFPELFAFLHIPPIEVLNWLLSFPGPLIQRGCRRAPADESG